MHPLYFHTFYHFTFAAFWWDLFPANKGFWLYNTDRCIILLPSSPPSLSLSFCMCICVFLCIQFAVMQAHGVHCQFSRPDCPQPTLDHMLLFSHTAALAVSFFNKKIVLLPRASTVSKLHILTRRWRDCNRNLSSCFASVRLLTFVSSRFLPYSEYGSSVFLLCA